MAEFPNVLRVRQELPGPTLDHIPQRVAAGLDRLLDGIPLQAGATVAITAGSRGICCMPQILKGAVDTLYARGARPFIIPAMGSHGGATAEGQQAQLARLGITEDFCGCPIRSTMETVVIGTAPQGIPIHFDRHAYEADHVLICNRVKPHTRYHGEIQSGLLKMMLLGLGKHAGAITYHRAFHDYGFENLVRPLAEQVFRSRPILGGLAILENARDEVAHIEGVPVEQLLVREPELLRMAIDWMARLPFDQADLLIVDQIGKDISGTGMDTNVVGRKNYEHHAAPNERPQIGHIFVRGLTEQTHGNATGLGMSEFCLQRVLDVMDRESTAINCITAGHVTAAMVPLVYATDREAIKTALQVIGMRAPSDARVMRIPNTLELEEIECSEAYLGELAGRPELTLVGGPRPLSFDRDGFLS